MATEAEWLSLDPGEEVVWRGTPRTLRILSDVAKFVVLSLAGLVAAFVVTRVLNVALPVPDLAAWGVAVLWTLLQAVAPARAYLQTTNTDYVVTNEALYVKKGVASTNIESVGLDKIQNTEYSQSFWGKQFDFGSIEISTAGSSGAQITFQNIENARGVRETITGLGNEYSSGGRRSSADGDESSSASPTASSMDDLVEELRATRQALERVERHLSEPSGATVEDAPTDESRPDRDPAGYVRGDARGERSALPRRRFGGVRRDRGHGAVRASDGRGCSRPAWGERRTSLVTNDAVGA